MKKVSIYNIEVEYSDGILLYNTRTNQLLPISFKDYAVIETLMEHLPTFQEKYLDLYTAFEKSGFIISSDFDELAYIKLQNKRSVFMNRDYHLTINPTLDCNLKCWYCSVGHAGAIHNKERMSDEMINSLNKHIDTLATQQNANSILLDWFGGEPMMYFDEVMRKVSDSALEITSRQNIKFWQKITTNVIVVKYSRIKVPIVLIFG